MRIFISITPISSPNPMFDHLLESSHRDDSNKWSNIRFGEEIKQVGSIEVNFTHFIWSSEHINSCEVVFKKQLMQMMTEISSLSLTVEKVQYCQGPPNTA